MEISLTQMDERACSYDVSLGIALHNARGKCYPMALQRLAIGVVETHLARIGLDAPKLVREHGVSWVLLSFSAEQLQPLSPDRTYRAQTWHTSLKGPVFRRDFVITDGDTPVVVGATYSTLLDVKKRRICTDRTLLAPFLALHGEELLTAEHRWRENLPFTAVETRRVRPSWIDGLGHVNNMRYAELAYDALSEAEQQKIDDFRRMDVYFIHELTANELFTVEKAEKESAIVLRGMCAGGTQPSFVVELTY